MTITGMNDEIPGLLPEEAETETLNYDPAEAVAAEISRINEPENPLPPVTLQDLSPALQEAVERAGWKSLMPVQSRALPYLLAGQDMLVQSRTGSGKTGAFLLPALERLDASRKECQALILTPTRELALQVAHEASVMFAGTGLSAAALYGGVSYSRQADALKEGAQIVVGTPGRILDHLMRRTLRLDGLRMLVFDEADRMLSVGFYQDMKEIQRYLPRKKMPEMAVHFFSATFPGYVLRMADEFMTQPALLSLSHNQVHLSQIEHVFYAVKPMEKDRVLVRVLEKESPTAAIIFCNTKANVHYVTGVLQGFGYNAAELSADLSQNKREEVLREVRQGKVRFLVATDVAARGIDIPDLSHVVLYEPPEDKEAYIHRAGRTGRAGSGGTAISLVDIMQKMELDRIAKHYKIDIKERKAPDEAELSDIVGERLITLLEARLRSKTGLQKERMSRYMPLVKTLAAEEDSSHLLAMLLDGIYQASLHQAILMPSATVEKRPEASRSGGGGGGGGGARRGGRRRR